jgi:hypothetical protein
MAEEEVSIRQLISRVQLGNFRGYLIEHGWSEKPSRYVDHVYFQGAIHDGGAPYDLYLPASPDAPKYHATLMRAIYKLCGIEDREPQDIARDVIATKIAVDRPAGNSGTKTRLRFSNTGSRPLQLRIELICDVAATGSLEIEHGDDSLTILTSGRR